MFRRRNKKLSRSHKINLTPHPGTWLINRSTFWFVGGIEERMNGEYGYEDTLLTRCLSRYNMERVIPNNIFLDNVHGDDSFDDVEGCHKVLSTRNKKIYDDYLERRCDLSKSYFNFEWKRTL